MSELETFRDHCRAMANWQPPKAKTKTTVGHWCRDLRVLYNYRAGDEFAPKHDQCTFAECACECHPQPEPPTGPSDADRALFTRVADEVDACLTCDDEPLFETQENQ